MFPWDRITSLNRMADLFYTGLIDRVELEVLKTAAIYVHQD